MRTRNKVLFINKITAAFIFLALLVFIYLSINRGLAALAYRQVDIDLIENNSSNSELIQGMLSDVEVALSYYPNRPEYLDSKGQLLEYLVDLPGTSGKERKSTLRDVTEIYQTAIKQRPLWPYSWINLLNVKDKLGEIDGEYLKAFNRSNELGPWEPKIQMRLIRSGLKHWAKLQESQRQQTIMVIERAMKRQPSLVFELIQSYNRPDLVCHLEFKNKAFVEYCDKTKS